MKKTIKLLSIFMGILMLVSCSESFDKNTTIPNIDITTGSNSKITQPQSPVEPTEDRVYPKTFSNFEELFAYLNQTDPLMNEKKDYHSESYYERVKKGFGEVFEEYHENGYFLELDSELSEGWGRDPRTIYPLAPYEDIGIRRIFKYKDHAIYIIVYQTKDSLTESLEDKTKTYGYDYFVTRFGSKWIEPSTEMTVELEGETKIAYLKEYDDQYKLRFFLDDSCYISVRTTIPVDDLKEFLKSLKIEKIYLDVKN